MEIKKKIKIEGKTSKGKEFKLSSNWLFIDNRKKPEKKQEKKEDIEEIEIDGEKIILDFTFEE